LHAVAAPTLALKRAAGGRSRIQPPAGALVSFDIPAGRPIPVTVLLRLLAKQAHVAIAIDRSVPSGRLLRVDGQLSPRPLPDALRAVSSTAHLDWRRDGRTIVVSAGPRFRAFYTQAAASQRRMAPLRNGSPRAAVAKRPANRLHNSTP
jgi:hypothetical protein